MANSASCPAPLYAAAPSRRAAGSRRPFRRGGIFLLPIHSPAQVWRVSCMQRPAICYLGDRITCVADLRRFDGAERMVPIATRKGFMGGEDVQPTR
jgi:hypothetical protein